MRATITDLKLKDGSRFKVDLSSANTYYQFGMSELSGDDDLALLMPERNWSSEWYRYGFQGQEKDDEIKGKGNSVNYKFRMHDTRLGRFFTIDPLTPAYPWNSPFAFSENRVIDGLELEGLEWENFLSGFKDPGELSIKLPDEKKAQKQYYSVVISNTKIPFAFEYFKKTFMESPNEYLSNSKAEFHSPVNGKGKPSQFKEGSYLYIEIDGPMNDGYVKVKSLEEDKETGNLSATFVTLEGHVEKGIIQFTLSQNENKDIKFEINSTSEVDFGMVTESFARDEQKKSWEEVLTNVKTKLDGKEKSREVKITKPKN